MKRIILIAILLTLYAPAHAFDIWGDHHHHKHPGVTYAAPPSDPPVTPDTPTNPVPEPASLLMLGAGLVGLAAWARRRD